MTPGEGVRDTPGHRRLVKREWDKDDDLIRKLGPSSDHCLRPGLYFGVIPVSLRRNSMLINSMSVTQSRRPSVGERVDIRLTGKWCSLFISVKGLPPSRLSTFFSPFTLSVGNQVNTFFRSGVDQKGYNIRLLKGKNNLIKLKPKTGNGVFIH